MKNLINKTIVDYKYHKDEVVFFCNDADYFYQVKSPHSWTEVSFYQLEPGPISVVEIKRNEDTDEIMIVGDNGAAILINLLDDQKDVLFAVADKNFKLIFKGKDNED